MFNVNKPTVNMPEYVKEIQLRAGLPLFEAKKLSENQITVLR